MSFVDPDQALGLLNDLGYRSAFRLDAWVECLVWVEEERWIGRGASRARRCTTCFAIFSLKRITTFIVECPWQDGSFSSVESRVSRAHRPRESTGSAPMAAVERLPRATPEGPLELGSSVDDRDPEDVLADVGLLDELIDSKRPEMALMSPVRQRLSILSWICHARAAQGSGSHSRVVTAVTHIARKLTLLSKRWWPGSPLSLQLDATPFHVGRELDLPRTEWPRTWAEAARCAEERSSCVSRAMRQVVTRMAGWTATLWYLPR